jgi:hypothetical protein
MESLRVAGGDLALAIKQELMRVPLNLPLVRSAVLEYCRERGMSAGTLVSKGASPEGGNSRKASGHGCASGDRQNNSAAMELVEEDLCNTAGTCVAGRGTASVPSRAVLRAAAFSTWLDGLCEHIIEGRLGDVQTQLVNSEHAMSAPLGPELLFKLKRLEMLQLLEAGHVLGAHALLREKMGHLVCAHPELAWLLKVCMPGALFVMCVLDDTSRNGLHAVCVVSSAQASHPH